MLKIALTGGIGSGKTTVARIFEILGIPVYYADDEAKRLMNEDPSLRELLSNAFGETIFADGKVDRSRLSDLVFQDPEKLSLLNSIVHPATGRDAEKWMQRQKAPYAIKEAALIFEAGLESQFNFVIGVTAPEPLRIARVMERDSVPADKVRQRINNQLSDVVKMSRCHFVVDNDEKTPVIPQVLAIHEQLLIAASPVPL